MHYFLDTEFTNLPWLGDSELLWIALVDETGQQEFSAINGDCPLNSCSPFVQEKILPYIYSLPRFSREELQSKLKEFITPYPMFWSWMPSIDDMNRFVDDDKLAVQMWHQYSDWDYQLLLNLFGNNPPSDWPLYCQDLHALANTSLISIPENLHSHNALADAQWGRTVWQKIKTRK